MNENPIFSIVPIEVAMDRRLSMRQMRVLLALFSFRGKTTNMIWPSRKALSERTGLDASTISTATSDLVRLGWLKKEGRGGKSMATRYTLCVPDFDAQTVAESVTVAESATRKELTIELTKEQTKKIRVGSCGSVGFEKFWVAWPKSDRKQAKGRCLQAWKKQGLEHIADTVLAHVERMKASDSWRRGYEPMPLTYLNQKRWEGADGLRQPDDGMEPWWLGAGFANVWEAESAGCYARNASEFAHGKRRVVA